MAKDATYRRMINSVRWLRLRRSVLGERPVCADCLAGGFPSPAVEVHHAVPVELGRTAEEKERLMFDPHNLVPLCHACHVARHVRMGRGGRERVRERSASRAAETLARFGIGPGGGEEG